MAERKFYKTIFTIEVLSEEPIDAVTLNKLAYEITEGDWNGSFTQGYSMELNGKEMASALKAQGSDSWFFQLDHNGNNLLEVGDDVLVLNTTTNLEYQATIKSSYLDTDGSIYYTVVDQDDNCEDVTPDRVRLAD